MEEESPEPLECDDLLEHLLQYQQPALPAISPLYPHRHHRHHHHHHQNHIVTTDSEDEEDEDDDEEEEEDSLEPSRRQHIGGKVQVRDDCSYTV